MTSLACIEGSGLNIIFQWNVCLFILHKSLQSCSAVLLGSSITKNKETSYANNFQLSKIFGLNVNRNKKQKES